MPEVYKAPGSKVAGEFRTVYLTPRGEHTVFPGDKGVKISQITDGTSNTILAVEASDDKAVIWTKPDDLEFDTKDPIAGLVGLRDGGFLAAFCDGHVELIPQGLDAEGLDILFDRDDGKARR